MGTRNKNRVSVPSAMKIVYTTVKTAGQAEKISGALLAQGGACASYWKIRSAYVWKGKQVKETEYALEIKCADACAEKLAKLAEKIHPYKLPMVLILGVRKSNAAYAHWLENK